jgi:hypothetical protein
MRKIKGSFSQTLQESFVINILEGKSDGYYVEIGAYHSTIISNTYLLESKYKFLGLALEIDEQRAREYSLNRKNPVIQSDARRFDYKKYFRQNKFPLQIDYLQCDIEPAINTFLSLIKVTSTGHRFSIVTFEHDQYLNHLNKIIASLSRIYMKMRGYKLVVKNVSNELAPKLFHEDWYLDSKFLKHPDTKLFRKNICCTDLFNEK